MRLRLASGREAEATADSAFLMLDRRTWLSALKVADRLAVPQFYIVNACTGAILSDRTGMRVTPHCMPAVVANAQSFGWECRAMLVQRSRGHPVADPRLAAVVGSGEWGEGRGTAE